MLPSPRTSSPAFVLVLACIGATGTAVAQTHVLNYTRLVAARSALRDGTAPAALRSSLAVLLRNAETSLRRPLASVMNKTIQLPPGSGVSRHEYVSIGIYNHPCNALPVGCKPYPGGHLLPPAQCDNGTGLPWEPCDGIRNADAIAEGDAPAQEQMVNAVVDLTMAAFMLGPISAEDNTGPAQLRNANGKGGSGNDHGISSAAVYAERAALVLRTWFLDNATAMLPDLYYGQIMPRATPPSKSHGGFIEWAHTAFLLDHIVLLRAADPGGLYWTQDDTLAMKAWWAQFEQYVNGHEAQGERRMVNNHGSWFDVTWSAIASFTGNDTAVRAAAHEVNEQRIAYQILPNGTEWIELERNVPSGYCQYNLRALAQAADIAASNNAAGAPDVWHFATPDGRSLRRAIDWLMPYATGEAAWPYAQPEAPDWISLWQPLRRASIALRNRTYEEAACVIMARAGKLSEYTASTMNLQLPALFAVNCSV